MPETEKSQIGRFSVRHAIKSFFVAFPKKLAEGVLSQHNGKPNNSRPNNCNPKTSK